MDIQSEFPIYKVNDRVFLIDDVDYDFDFILSIVSILNQGSKFVPCWHFFKIKYL